MILPDRVGHLGDRKPDAVSALAGVSVDVSNGLGPGGGGLVVHSADHRLDNQCEVYKSSLYKSMGAPLYSILAVP